MLPWSFGDALLALPERRNFGAEPKPPAFRRFTCFFGKCSISKVPLDAESLCEKSLSGIAEPLWPFFSDGSKSA